MVSQKADNQLNLALSLPEDIRQQSNEISVGYVKESQEWEVIVKYIGDLEQIKQELNAQVTELLNNYAIIVLKQDDIPRLIEYSQIVYIEKPKLLTFELVNGISASCISSMQRPPSNLTGKGIIVAVIDSGIDYAHPGFRNADGTSRILYLWDQTIAGTPPDGYYIGTLYTKEQIDEAISKPTQQEREAIVPSNDTSGHGTHVAGICCGNGSGSNNRYRGVAFDSEMIVVKLGRSVGESFPSTAQLMEAMDFCIKKSIELAKPIAVNISFGNSYGSHTGHSLLEGFIDSLSGVGRNNICIGTGNEGDSGRHVEGVVSDETVRVSLSVGERQTTFNVELWKYPYDYMDVSVVAPDGRRIGPLNDVVGSQKFSLSDYDLYVYYGEPSPYSIYVELFFLWIPRDGFVSPGEWVFELTPKKIVSGDFFFWLPTGAAINDTTRFLRPSVETTLTIPSTAENAISVGAYNSNNDSIAPFSGRGYTVNNNVKPDLVAPGVGIISASPGGGYTAKTGTSMATPFVTGACAMLMQYGITDGNDPFLYGEKIKAYLLVTARELPSFTIYPNETVGYGALCLQRVDLE